MREGFCSFGLQAGVGVRNDFDHHGESMSFWSTVHLERGTSSSFPDFSSSAVLLCRTLLMPNKGAAANADYAISLSLNPQPFSHLSPGAAELGR